MLSNRRPLFSFFSSHRRPRTTTKAMMMTTITSLLLLLAAAASAATSTLHERNLKQQHDISSSSGRRRLQDFTPMGMQSGPDTGDSIASAVTVHNNNEIWLVGSTHGNWFQPHTPESGDVSGCFLAQIVSNNNWGARLTLDTPQVPEDCSSLLWLSNTRVVLSGHAEPGGILEDLFDPAGYNVVDHFGMLLDLNIEQQQVQDQQQDATTAIQMMSNVEILGGNLMQQVASAYPIAMTMDTSDPPSIYVVSMESNKVNSADSVNRSTPLDWHVMNDPLRFFPTGLSFNMVVTKMIPVNPNNLDDSGPQESIQNSWRIPYATKYDKTVHTAAIQKIRDHSTDVLVVAGTTTGRGAVFGSSSTDSDGRTDLDGFVTRLSTSTGKLESATPLTRRINSLNNGDDWVGGMCVHESSGDIYVVGSTAGSMLKDAADYLSGSTTSGGAGGIDGFLLKLNASNLETVWAYQLGAKPRSADDGPATATGVSCAVTQDGAFVYMAGVVEKGAVLEMSGTLSSYGDDDVFVVQLNALTGQVNFVRQIGSEANDEVALRDALSVDQDGNAVLVGTTFGSFYRQRDPLEAQTSDVFVATISKFNGALVNPIVRPEFENDADGDGSPDTSDSSTSEPSDDSQKTGFGIGMFVLLFLVVALTVYFCFFYRRVKSAVLETDRTKVLGYISKFDVEDVDLKHSATGGWHCSYSGSLAMGINNRSLASRPRYSDSRNEEEETEEDSSGTEHHLMAPLTGILEDSLYEEEEEEPRGLDASSGKVRRKQYHNSSLLGDLGWQDEQDERVSGIVNDIGRASQRNRNGGWGRDIV